MCFWKGTKHISLIPNRVLQDRFQSVTYIFSDVHRDMLIAYCPDSARDSSFMRTSDPLKTYFLLLGNKIKNKISPQGEEEKNFISEYKLNQTVAQSAKGSQGEKELSAFCTAEQRRAISGTIRRVPSHCIFKRLDSAICLTWSLLNSLRNCSNHLC